MARSHVRLLGLAVLVLSLVAFAGPACGQGMLGLTWPSLSSLGSCGSQLGAPDFFIGWADHWRGATFSNTTNENGIPGPLIPLVRYMGSKRNFPVRGLWLGVAETVPISEHAYVVLNGSYLVPSNGRAQEDYDWRTIIFSDPQERSWSTKIQWWTVDAALAWKYTCSWAALIGIRRDAFGTTFGDTQAMQGVLGRTRGLPTDESELTVDTWIPYVGLVLDQRSDPTSLRVGAIGFPVLPGHVRYANSISSIGAAFDILTRLESSGGFSSGYFLEAFFEYSRCMNSLKAGIFGKWTLVHGTAAMDLNGSYAGFPTGTENAFSISWDRQVFVLGAQVALGFSSPL